MRFVLPVLALVAALFAAAFLLGGAGRGADAQQVVTVTMSAGRDASQTGTATLTAQGAKTQVVINIQSGGAGVAQPVHIHEGACPGVAAVKYPLTNVVDGTSTTVVDASLSSLQTGGLSINAHKGTSQTDLNIYVSCGRIPAAASPTTGPTATTGAVPRSGGPPATDGSALPWAYLLIAGGALALAGGGTLAFHSRRIR